MSGKIFSPPPRNWQTKPFSEMSPEERAKMREMIRKSQQKTDSVKTSTPTRPLENSAAGKSSLDTKA